MRGIAQVWSAFNTILWQRRWCLRHASGWSVVLQQRFHVWHAKLAMMLRGWQSCNSLASEQLQHLRTTMMRPRHLEQPEPRLQARHRKHSTPQPQTSQSHLHARHVGLTFAKRMMPPDAVEGVATDILRVCAPAHTKRDCTTSRQAGGYVP